MTNVVIQQTANTATKL